MIVAEGAGSLADLGAIKTARPRAEIGAPWLRLSVVPVAAGTVAALAFRSLPYGPTAAIAGFLAGVLVVIAATDIERRIIPNQIVLPAIAIVLIARIAFFPARTLEWTAAALLAAAVLMLPRLRNPAAMGMGDVKLAMLIGAALGWGAFVALAVAFLSSLPVAAVLLVRRGRAAREAALPFGPFLAVGALLVVFTPYLTGTPAV